MCQSVHVQNSKHSNFTGSRISYWMWAGKFEVIKQELNINAKILKTSFPLVTSADTRVYPKVSGLSQ